MSVRTIKARISKDIDSMMERLVALYGTDSDVIRAAVVHLYVDKFENGSEVRTPLTTTRHPFLMAVAEKEDGHDS